MKVRWLGHAAVLISSDVGTRIIIDPYKPGYFPVPAGSLAYKDINEPADIVLVSHEHPDHNNVSAVQGYPEIIRSSDSKETSVITVRGIQFRWFPCYHDDVKGELLGKTNAVCFEVDGLRVFYDGDMGHVFSSDQMAAIGIVDILLLCVGHLHPVGEPVIITDEMGQRRRIWKQHIIDGSLASRLYAQLAPRIVIPIHYSNDKCSFKINGIGTFLEAKKNVNRPGTSDVSLTRGKLPEDNSIIVLEPAL